MKKILLTIYVLGSLLLNVSAHAADYTAKSYGSFGMWAVDAFYNPNGSFKNCAMSTSLTDGGTLLFDVSSSGLQLLLANSNWSIPPGASTYGTVVIGKDVWGGWIKNGNTYSSTLSMQLPSNFGTDFVTHKFMKIMLSSGRTWKFNLNGASSSFIALDNCMHENIPGVINPFSN